LEEASVLLQVHEEGTNFFDSRFVNVRELSAKQISRQLPQYPALILFKPQIIPTIILR
jgi:hypothetical protein